MSFLCPVRHLAFNVPQGQQVIFFCDCYVLGHYRRSKYNYQKRFFYIWHVLIENLLDCPVRHLWDRPIVLLNHFLRMITGCPHTFNRPPPPKFGFYLPLGLLGLPGLPPPPPYYSSIHNPTRRCWSELLYILQLQ